MATFAASYRNRVMPELSELVAQHRAWEAAFELLNNHTDRLTPLQFIACQIAVMRHPDHASLTIIALAADLLGRRT